MSSTYKPSELQKFFVFNPVKFGLTEETEEEKVLYYWPLETQMDEKMNDIGLCEALITFSTEFAKVPTSSCRTEKAMYLLIQPEKGWWVVMVMKNPQLITTVQDKTTIEEKTEWKYDDLDEKALLTLLKRVYIQFKLFNGPFEYIFANYKDNIHEYIEKGFSFVGSKLKEIHKADIFSSLDGIHFLPVDKNVYLRIQSFINETENTFADQILYSSFMYKHYLVWSGLEQEEMRGIYRYVEEIYRNSQPSLSSSQTSINKKKGVFVGQDEKETQIISPKVYLGENSRQCYLIIYQYMDCSCTFLVASNKSTLSTSQQSLSVSFYTNLEKLIKPQIDWLAPIISEHAKKIIVEEGFKYLYFNHMNLALKSSIDRDMISHDISRVLNKMHADFELHTNLSEILISTQNDGWIVGRKSDQREFYIIFDKQGANLLEINDEVKKLSAAYFRDIFID